MQQSIWLLPVNFLQPIKIVLYLPPEPVTTTFYLSSFSAFHYSFTIPCFPSKRENYKKNDARFSCFSISLHIISCQHFVSSLRSIIHMVHCNRNNQCDPRFNTLSLFQKEKEVTGYAGAMGLFRLDMAKCSKVDTGPQRGQTDPLNEVLKLEQKDPGFSDLELLACSLLCIHMFLPEFST